MTISGSKRSMRITAAANVNAYLTPAGSQGFGTHFDTHDVFVLQTHGAKLWRLYEPSHRLPEGAETAAEHDSPPGPVKSTAELRPGDLLYLPRGTPHDATANESASLHLTIGVHPMVFAADQAVATSSYRHLADLMTDLA